MSSDRPLSWTEARSILKRLLEKYLEDRPPTAKRAPIDEDESLLAKWIRRDLDLYAGSLALSVVFLILAALSFQADSLLQPKAATPIYRAELIAAVMVVVGSLISVWVTRRRRFLCLNDSDTAKRREVRKFLRAKNKRKYKPKEEPTCEDTVDTGQTGVFPVYRRHETNRSGASWSKIPSLLLVQGDWIALQMGDICPASCTSLNKTHDIQIRAGERLTPEIFNCTAAQVSARLPRGRTTLSPRDSDHLLTLCNNLQIFVVTETPLESFIRRCSVAPKSSQVARQVKAVREALFVLALVFLSVTAMIAFSRRDFLSGDITFVVHLPILAAIGVLPVVGPAFLFFVEVLGTARILSTAHPYSSPTADPANDTKTRLLFRYILATALSRLSLWGFYEGVQNLVFGGGDSYAAWPKRSKLIRVPPASVNLLEKLGVATAFALIDDELACEPQSIPQQLLVPSGKGLKLLDLCPAHDADLSDDESNSESTSIRKQRGKSFDSDSESEDGTHTFQNTLRRRMRRNKPRLRSVGADDIADEASGQEHSRFETQFEEPNWWQYLPSLKCIGLACLLLDEQKPKEKSQDSETRSSRQDTLPGKEISTAFANSALVEMVCSERRSKQLRSLAECIGLSTEANASGPRGDVSAFTERLRLHVLSNRLFRDRLALDAHERSSEQSRWWGLIRPDSSSVIVQDSRTKAYQLLTVGDPTVVMNLCNEAWQGEISTILPLDKLTKETIRATTTNWRLGDLDVAAFSYTPVPHTLETQLTADKGSKIYLLDNADPTSSIAKDRSINNGEWSFIKNQVFLGVLGSLVVPRKEIKFLLDVLSDAGVRFVYFSPRNMRRQKELAIQMGIDVAWNCAISLRPLESGEDIDEHRMVSAYADWDVNARLPHGCEDVRKHLEEKVDNVPLLVSLFTDVTKATTAEMVEIFQEYNDTVISVGLSHLTMNEPIFARSDIAVGIDTLTETFESSSVFDSSSSSPILPAELEFVQSISAHSCAFRFQGASSVSSISTIIEKSRASLEAGIASAVFLTTACLSFSFYVVFSVCSPSTSMPHVPSLGSILYLQILLPSLALSVAMSDGDTNLMKQVPPKNDRSITFSRKESVTVIRVIYKAILPALLPQIQHLIVFGELVIHSESSLVAVECPGASTWIDIVRCGGLRDYSGSARTSAGSIVLAQFVLCIIVASAGFVHRFLSLSERKPWEQNLAWLCSVLVATALVAAYVSFATNSGTAAALPWYFYLLATTSPFICLFAVELVKRLEIKAERRAEKLRRLQFETRLGAWSPR